MLGKSVFVGYHREAMGPRGLGSRPEIGALQATSNDGFEKTAFRLGIVEPAIMISPDSVTTRKLAIASDLKVLSSESL